MKLLASPFDLLTRSSVQKNLPLATSFSQRAYGTWEGTTKITKYTKDCDFRLLIADCRLKSLLANAFDNLKSQI